jgi:hypothetical protein
MNWRVFKILVILLAIFIAFYSCSLSEKNRDEQLQIKLRWVRGYEAESKEDVLIGLKWCLSFLGARLPEGSIHEAAQWQTDTYFLLNLTRVGFSVQSESVLRKLLDDLKSSEEYQRAGAVDLGRFVALTLTCANNYYAITNVSPSYAAFRSRFHFEDSLAALVESGVAVGNRLIEFTRGQEVRNIAFIAHEGKMSVQTGTFKASEFEVFDFMENGQLRFAIYDSAGNLKTSGTPSITGAGKPAKCLWCHEMGIHLPFFSKTDVKGYYTIDQLARKVSAKMAIVTSYREKLKSDLDFEKKQEHSKAELLYLTFMEPSAKRLASEWNISTEAVNERLRAMETHQNEEFNFLGTTLYHRKDIDQLSPYQIVPVADSPREKSQFEPAFPIH